MKTILKFNGKEIEGKDFGLNFVIKVGKLEEDSNWFDYEDYVLEKIENNNIFNGSSIECPIDDEVYIDVTCITGEGYDGVAYPIDNKELDYFKMCYFELMKTFGEDRVKIALSGDLWGDANQDFININDLLNGIRFE